MTRVALIVGDGVSADIVPLVLRIVKATGARIQWQRVDVPTPADHTSGEPLEAAVAAIRECGTGLKTRLHGLPRGEGQARAPRPGNPNVLLRQRLGLYAGVRPIKALAGIQTRYPELDLILIRENTEDIYKGIEHEIVDGVVESLKVVTRDACRRIARFAFDSVATLGRRHVTFIHKANIMKMSDGLFLQTVREIACERPEVGFREMIVDAACMQLVLDPYQFDVLLTGNLYGDILSNLGSGLAGGISGAHSINIGDEYRVYESIHGDARHLEGTGLANPLPVLTPAVALLRHLGDEERATAIEASVTRILREGGPRTPDLGGSSSTEEMTEAIVKGLR